MKLQFLTRSKSRRLTAVLIASFCLLVEPFGFIAPDVASAASKVSDVSTGQTSVCAVVDKSVKCWGNGANGKLGDNSNRSSNKPVSVFTKAAWTEKVTCSSFEKFFGCKEKTIQHAASPLSGKTVSKVSVGVNHACAIANASVYCWGKNDKGQLGTGKSGWLQQETAPVRVMSKDGSALVGKEVIDVSAGDDFTCALASDGMVACWGEGDNGRLGNNSTADKNTPTPVFGHTAKRISYDSGTDVILAQKSSRDRPTSTRPQTDREPSSSNQSSNQATSPVEQQPVVGLSDKKGIKLAKASENTMCVVAVDIKSSQTSGSAYCWGRGVDSGQSIPAYNSTSVVCNEDAPTTLPRTSSKTTIFESSKPTLIPGAVLKSIDGQDYVSALGVDGKAYYWGMYGYQETVSYTDTKSCKVNPCTGKVSIYRSNDNLNITLAANMTERARDNARAGNADNRNRPKVVNGHPGMANYMIDKDNDRCDAKTHYGFTKNVTNTPVGKNAATQPSSWPAGESGFSALSGNVHEGLFCATNGTTVRCDAHGTSQTEGQTGSGFAQTCKFLGSCTPALPSGPQTVTGTGWLTGKQVTQLSTSSTGYTCAVASGTVGCWGANTKGQLGVGDSKMRNVPTGVEL